MPGPAEFYVEEEREHLGGYIVGGDPATYFPHLWEWLVRERGVRSVIDVGCGEGQALDYFADHGCRVRGVDGIAQADERIARHDYTLGPWPLGAYRTTRFDLAWSCEFVEHVAEEFVPNFLVTFDLADLVLMTHAEPGQPGHHHVNCRTSDYWIGALAAVGFGYDADLTAKARLMAGLNRNPINHFARAGLAFRRRA